MERITYSAMETEQCGAWLASQLISTQHIFIALYGDLGAGKTAFVRGFVSVLSPGSRVKSPTYTIVNEYRKGRLPVFHFDLYRIASETDLDSIGFSEYVQNGICIAEWCEHIGNALPENAVCVRIEKCNGDTDSTLDFADTGVRRIIIWEEKCDANSCC